MRRPARRDVILSMTTKRAGTNRPHSAHLVSFSGKVQNDGLGNKKRDKQHNINRQRKLWRDNWLTNRIFKSCGDLLNRCCESWETHSSTLAHSCPSECVMRPLGSVQWEQA
jgi:hypothetical protein